MKKLLALLPEEKRTDRLREKGAPASPRGSVIRICRYLRTSSMTSLATLGGGGREGEGEGEGGALYLVEMAATEQALILEGKREGQQLTRYPHFTCTKLTSSAVIHP